MNKKVHLIQYQEKALNYTIFDVKWVPCSGNFCVIGSKPKGTGILEIFKIKKKNSTSLLELNKSIEKTNSFRCGTFGASGIRSKHIAIGDFDGRLLILDLERPNTPILNTKAHNAIINSIDAIGGTQIDCGAPEIVTGSRDGTVKVWDPRQGDSPVVNISSQVANKNKSDGIRDCWAVAFGNSFNNDDRIVASGYDNGDIKLFDLRNLNVRWETTLRNGICSIEFDRKDIPMNKMVVTTLDGGLHVYDVRIQHSEKGFACVNEKDAGKSVGSCGFISGPKATLWTVKHLPQNRDVFMTCGGSGSLRLWNYIYPDKRIKETETGKNIGVAGTIHLLNATTMSSQPINCFDWHPNKQGLAVCGAFDQTVRVLITTNLNSDM